MSLYKYTCEEFIEHTFSKEPTPGGGSVASFTGALGIALGGMVCNLTAGKKKYAMYEDDIQRITKRADALKERFIDMMNEDAENFLPLSKAYSLPTATEAEKRYKEEELERCLKIATKTPINIVENAYECIALFEELSIKGSILAVSDVGCGIALVRSVLAMGWLNVMTNLNMIKDEEYVGKVKAKIAPLVESGVKKCDKIYTDVLKAI